MARGISFEIQYSPLLTGLLIDFSSLLMSLLYYANGYGVTTSPLESPTGDIHHACASAVPQRERCGHIQVVSSPYLHFLSAF